MLRGRTRGGRRVRVEGGGGGVCVEGEDGEGGGYCTC